MVNFRLRPLFVMNVYVWTVREHRAQELKTKLHTIEEDTDETCGVITAGPLKLKRKFIIYMGEKDYNKVVWMVVTD